MSTRFPLTPAGVQQKQEELYALNDQALLDQARLIGCEFRQWLQANFELNAEQQSYFNNMPENYSTALGYQLASTVIGRSPIHLEDGQFREASRAINARKSTETSISGGMEWSPGGSPTYTLTLTITFR